MVGWKLKAATATAVVIFALRVLIHKQLKCNLASVVDELCSAYQTGYVTGPLCPDLCTYKNIQLEKCRTTVPEKKVYEGEWQGRKVVLKINMSWFEEFEQHQQISDTDSVLSYSNDVASIVKTLFGDCALCNTLASLFQTLGDANGDKRITASEARTFVSLLQFMEPTMLMTLNKSEHTVNFYGYCGGLYVVEKVHLVASDIFKDTWELLDISFLPDEFEPLQRFLNYHCGRLLNTAASFILRLSSALSHGTLLKIAKCHVFSSFFQIHITSQREKFDFSYSLLDATLDISTSHYGIIQSCDTHLGNYGMTDKSVVKLIDLDLLYPQIFLRSALEQKNCSSDSHCFVGRFDYCWSDCNMTAHLCKTLLGFQDLHLICQGLFPTIFNLPNLLEPTGHNVTCLQKAVRRLAVFCSKIPVVYSAEETRRNIMIVRKKLESIESKLTESC